MSDFITLTCNSCGGKLQITSDIDTLACMHCGTEFRVRREGGIIALSPLMEEMRKVSISTGKTASEFAIVRLRDVISKSYSEINENKEQFKEWSNEKEEELVSLKNRGKSTKVTLLGIMFVIFLIIINSVFIALSIQAEIWAVIFSLIISATVSYLVITINPNDIFNKKKIQKLEEEIKTKKRDHYNNERELENLLSLNKKQLKKHEEIVSKDI